jgi:hypothetical protein
MFKNRCYNGGKKHKFEPRYSKESYPTIDSAEGVRSVIAFKEILESTKHTKIQYIKDICVWCGKTINKEN